MKDAAGCGLGAVILVVIGLFLVLFLAAGAFGAAAGAAGECTWAIEDGPTACSDLGSERAVNMLRWVLSGEAVVP